MASNPSGMPMASTLDDSFMWDEDCGSIAQIEEFAIRNSSQPRLQVEIPKRSVRGEP